MSKMGKVIRWVVGVFVVLLVAILFFTCSATVEQSRVAVVTTFGNITSIQAAGFHLKTPFDEFNMVNVEQQQVTEDYMTATKDLQSVTQSITAQVQVSPDVDTIKNLYSQFLGNHVDGIVKPTLYSAFKSATAEYTIQEVITDRASLEKRMLDIAKPQLEAYGINLVSVQIANVELPSEYSVAVEEKMVAEQKLLTAQTQQQTATVQAETNKITSAALDDKILSNKIIERWNGVLPTTVSGDSIGLDLLIQR